MDPKKISDITLERYILKELDRQTTDELEILLKKSPDLRARLNALEESTIKILSQYDPDYMVTKIRRKMQGGLNDEGSFREHETIEETGEFARPVDFWSRRKTSFIPTILTAAAIMVIVILALPPNVPQNQRANSTEISDATRIKGNAHKIFIYRKQNNDIEMLTNEAKAKKGDLLQIAYLSSKQSYGMIFSLDGRGNLTLHFPERLTGKDQTFEKLQTTAKVLLPTSYELDDAPGYEQFFLLSSDNKESIRNVISMIDKQVSSGLYQKSKTLIFGSTMEIESLLLIKAE